jgi:hypothetical protein
MSALLPVEFADLEPHARIWCLPTETQRWQQRRGSTMPEMIEFYDAFFPRLDEAIGYCDKFGLDELPEDATHLLWLIYSLVMVAMAVEIFHQPAPTDSADAELERTKEPLP